MAPSSPDSGDTRASPADSSRAIAESTRRTSVESDANHAATVSPVRRASSRRIQDGVKRQQLRHLIETSEPLEGSRLLRASPYGAIGTPVTRGRNPLSAPFVPAAVPAAPPSGLNPNAPVFHPLGSGLPGSNLPGSDILELSVLNQFPPYAVRREMHNSNHREWSRMLRRVQNDNLHAVGAIQQFAEAEKQRYKEMM